MAPRPCTSTGVYPPEFFRAHGRRHIVHEVTSPQAFEGLRNAGRKVRRNDCTLATVDHNVPTSNRKDFKDSSSFIKECVQANYEPG